MILFNKIDNFDAQSPIAIHPVHVVSVIPSAAGCTLTMSNGDNHDILGTFTQVVEQLVEYQEVDTFE